MSIDELRAISEKAKHSDYELVKQEMYNVAKKGKFKYVSHAISDETIQALKKEGFNIESTRVTISRPKGLVAVIKSAIEYTISW